MTIDQVMTALRGRPDLFAVRPTGKIISVTNRGGIRQHGRGAKPCNFTPMISDLVTNDWEIRTIEQMTIEAQKMAEAAAARGAS